jgi:ribokinase
LSPSRRFIEEDFMADILVIGSANMDLVVAVDSLPRAGETVLGGQFQTFAGGKGANQAVAAARAGGSVAMLGSVGDDGFGESLRAGLEAEGIDTSALATAQGPSGVAIIATDKTGENLIAVAPGANALVDVKAVDQTRFDRFRVVLTQLETPMETIIHAAKKARAAGVSFILDPAPAQPLPPELLALTDWLTPNETEAAILLGLPEDTVIDAQAAIALQAAGAGNVILKLGARGVIILEKGGTPVAVASPQVHAVDTTAAGDCFNGAFAVGLTQGQSPVDAARLACTAASISVTRHGAQAAMPSRAEIDAH